MCEKDGGNIDKPRHIDHRETEDTAPLSVGESNYDNDGPIVYTDEELNAIRDVRAKLAEDYDIPPSRASAAFVAVATINCKCRVDEAATKIAKLLELMAKLGCPDGVDDELWKPDAVSELNNFAPAGKDRDRCGTTWIRGGSGVKKELERAHCHACIMQWLAVHADPRTLRHGVSFVIDLSSQPDMSKLPKQGNEKLIQSFYQAMPLRPQAILIAGCSLPTRVFVNMSVRLASLFIKQKILERIKFVTVEQAVKTLPEESVPAYLGGGGGGVERYEDWVRERLEGLTAPYL